MSRKELLSLAPLAIRHLRMPADERMDPRREPAYAIIRIDDIESADVSLEDRVTVKSVVWSLDRARSEVDRLNGLNQDKGCRYFWQYTRVDRRDVE